MGLEKVEASLQVINLELKHVAISIAVVILLMGMSCGCGGLFVLMARPDPPPEQQQRQPAARVSTTSERRSPALAPAPSKSSRQAKVQMEEPKEATAVVEAPAPKSVPEKFSFRIIDEVKMAPYKRAVDIRLDGRVSEATLESLAKSIKAADGASYDRTFIGYYLPGMKVDSGYWATTHYNPHLKVEVLGLTKERFEEFMATPPSSERDEIGRWIDESLYVGRRIVIFRDGDKLFLESTYGDGSMGVEEVTKVDGADGPSFYKLGEAQGGDYWRIDSEGRLLLLDDEGVVSLARKIP
ncbi:MAG: hypothetical protein Aurels2KO_21910 [Aureliella sp.]